MSTRFRRALARATVISALLAGGTSVLAGTAGATDAAPAPTGLDKVQHIVVIYLENWSFDSLYGLFPGADGLAQATSAPPQVDQDGQPYSVLPQVLSPPPGDEGTNPLVAENSAVAKPAPPLPVDARFPADLPNQPFSLAPYAPATTKVADPGAGFYQEQAEIDGGKMDRFVLDGKSGALPLGWYDATQLPLGRLAAQYTLLDHFFHAAYGGSLLNHFFLIGAAAPRWPNAPAVVRAKLALTAKCSRTGRSRPTATWSTRRTAPSARTQPVLPKTSSSRRLPM